jgi:short-subunit dehydrogenase
LAAVESERFRKLPQARKIGMGYRARPIQGQPGRRLDVPATAAITGAAGGLGTVFARSLAARGYDLFLTDRDADALQILAHELRANHAVHVATVGADLAQESEVEAVQARLAPIENLSILINNAGFGTYAFFHEADLARQVDMVNVHVLATMRLCHAVLPSMVAKHRGWIVNVASAGAFMRFPRDATYIGTKSFLVAFTECLAIELTGTGVAIQCLCPAWVRTGFNQSDDYANVGYRSPIPRWLFASPEQVVDSSLENLGKGATTHIPTLRARLAVAILGSRLGLAGLARLRRRRARAGR